MPDPEAGKRLRALLERARIDGETQDELARRLGLTGKSALHRWFTGHEPSGGGFRAIARVCGVPRCRVVAIWDNETC